MLRLVRELEKKGDVPVADVQINGVRASAYEIPTDSKESDGTLTWDATTIVVVHCRVGDVTGLRVPSRYRHGFTVDDIQVIFRGRCEECAKEN